MFWLRSVFNRVVSSIKLERQGNISVFITKDNLIQVISFLKFHSNCNYKTISDLSCTDFFISRSRFEICYQILSYKFVNRTSIKVRVLPSESVPSISSVFSVANWFEREAFDMFGLFFESHPDLRRILTDYGFEGYPIRKDFPLCGYSEIKFDFEKRRVVCFPIQISQELRFTISNLTRKSNVMLAKFYLFKY
ncbi:hypothetical protein AB834_02370 [PVC group bacterium (ex Bugula neritina AB1)]|nr:hypothetical protein AB834_02370 [PVC group bacterium (ex Bugula neritina AB1)]